MNLQQRKHPLRSPEFWFNVYWIVIAAAYVAWRAVIFLKRIQ